MSTSDDTPEEDAAVESVITAQLAAHAAEMAAENIRRYLKAHSDTAMGPSKPVNRVMKIADALDADMKAVANSAAELAAKSLKIFTEGK